MFFAAAAALAAPPVAAQTAGDVGEAPPEETRGWRLYPNERHVLVRAEATVGARLNDPYAQGALAPITPFLQGSYLFLRAGGFLMGPSLGAQAGIDPASPQFTAQVGWQVYRRFSGRFAFTGRLDVPLLITRGACPVDRVNADPGFPGYGIEPNRNTLPVPSTGYCPAVGVGVEAAAGAALYITSGVALTAEAIFDMYFGDSAILFPVVGGGLGLMVDYEVLP